MQTFAQPALFAFATSMALQPCVPLWPGATPMEEVYHFDVHPLPTDVDIVLLQAEGAVLWRNGHAIDWHPRDGVRAMGRVEEPTPEWVGPRRPGGRAGPRYGRRMRSTHPVAIIGGRGERLDRVHQVALGPDGTPWAMYDTVLLVDGLRLPPVPGEVLRVVPGVGEVAVVTHRQTLRWAGGDAWSVVAPEPVQHLTWSTDAEHLVWSSGGAAELFVDGEQVPGPTQLVRRLAMGPHGVLAETADGLYLGAQRIAPATSAWSLSADGDALAYLDEGHLWERGLGDGALRDLGEAGDADAVLGTVRGWLLRGPEGWQVSPLRTVEAQWVSPHALARPGPGAEELWLQRL